MKNKKIFLITATSLTTLISILIVIFSRGKLTFNIWSGIVLLYMLGVIIYGIIAHSMREEGNIFFLGSYKLVDMVYFSFRKTPKYVSENWFQKAFDVDEIIYFAAIPFYIPAALLSNGYFSALGNILSISIAPLYLALFCTIGIRVTDLIAARKRENKEAEVLKREQARRESMGEWK